MSKKNSILQQVLITDIASEGKSIGRHEDKVIFVENAVPGDIVDIRITKNKKNFAEGVAFYHHKLSEYRESSFCSHFGTCGGCKWQNLSYSQQLVFKEKQVKDNLERIAKVELTDFRPILASAQTSFYRNKLEFTFSNKRWLTQDEINSGQEFDRDALGFHIPGRFDKIVDIFSCYLQADPSNEIRTSVRDYAREKSIPFFDLVKQEGYLRNLIIRTTSTGEVMVIVQVADDVPEFLFPLLDFLKEKFPQLTSLMYVINRKRNETFHDLEVSCYSGKPYITEKMENLSFRIGPKSFYQTNSLQAYELYKVAREFAGLTGKEVVYDLYTGTGTIANFVAADAKKVIGIEYVEMAIEDAKINSSLNQVENTLFFAGDMKDILTPDFAQIHGKPEVIITDPPRAGMHEDVVRSILSIEPERIVYVSCNPSTQARDIALLSEKYSLKAVQPVDMFPHTHHVENVVKLVRR